jgi:hypothetical protein
MGRRFLPEYLRSMRASAVSSVNRALRQHGLDDVMRAV